MQLRRMREDRRIDNAIGRLRAPFADRSKARVHRSSGARLKFELLEPRLALAGVVINEFLALNTDGLTDQDGQRSDWIELKNTDSAPVNIDGWHLADSVDNWRLPSVTLAPNEHLLVFASGKNRAVAGQELHTNFQLDSDGESLKLLMPDGTTVVDAFDPFPAQLADISFGRTAGTVSTDRLIDEEVSVRVSVPTGPSAIDNTWYALSFDDSAWTQSTAGIGFDNNTDGTNLETYVGLNLEAAMNGQSSSAYIRVPFAVADPSALLNLKLRIRYDDGFGLYLNGTPITSAWRSAPATLSWNSAATSGRSPQSAAESYLEIDLSAYGNLLQPGENVLAVHGLNSSPTSSDFLIEPLLIADRAGVPIVGYMVAPSPRTANLEGTLGFVADTKFSADRGFYTSAFNVQITTATPDATIRYTVDGSPPTATTGLVYDPLNPPRISQTTTLRAAAFKSGYTPSNIDTQTYLFLDQVVQQDGVDLPPYAPWGKNRNNPIPDWEMDPNIVNHPLYASTIKNDLQAVSTVSLVMPWNDWFGTGGQGIYIQGTSIERSASFELFNASRSENYESIATVEIQGGGAGGTSADRWKADKLSIQVKFKQPGPTKLDAPLFTNPLFDEGATTSFDTFILDAVLNYSWHHGTDGNQRANAKFIQDQVVADLQNLMGAQAPHGRYVHLYLNGLYWGMYYLHERPDDSFAEEYLGGDKDDYDVVKHNGNTPVSGDATAPGNYAAMLSAVRQNLQVPSNFAAVKQKLDIDDFIDYMLANYYAGNTDWAHKNWYASFNRVDPNGRWRFHSWDAEHTFKSVSDDVTGRFDEGGPTEIHHSLMANPEYRLRFSDRVQKHFRNGGVLTPTGAGAVYAARAMEIDRAIVGESARWGDNRQEPAYTRAHWRTTQDFLLANYFPTRSGQVFSQFVSRGWLVPLAAPRFSQFGGEISAGFQLSLAIQAGSPDGAEIWYTLDGSDPRDAGTNMPAASAILYNGPITLNSSTQVNTRLFDGSSAGSNNDWSAIAEATFLLETSFPVRITELHYNPDERPGVIDDEDMEFIELFNTGSETVSLEGVSISEFASEPYTFGSGISLAAGERIVVARSPAVFQAVYGAGIRVAPDGYGNANLSNGGERITLRGPLGETLQDFVFDGGAPWPTAPDGDGPSLEIVDPLGDASNPANWRASAAIGGSPGTGGIGMQGDYDGNSLVDEADRMVWRASFGLAIPAGTGADGNGDGVVDSADYVVWRKAFSNGSSAEVATAAFVVPAKPEAQIDSSLPVRVPMRSRPSVRPLLPPFVAAESAPGDKLLMIELGDDAVDEYFKGSIQGRDELRFDDTPDGVEPSVARPDIVLNDLQNLWEDERWLDLLAVSLD
jgi:hypothetical protein